MWAVDAQELDACVVRAARQLAAVVVRPSMLELCGDIPSAQSTERAEVTAVSDRDR